MTNKQRTLKRFPGAYVLRINISNYAVRQNQRWLSYGLHSYGAAWKAAADFPGQMIPVDLNEGMT